VKKRGTGTTLRMGQACVPCRSVAASSLPKGACETDALTLLSLAVRQRKAVSGLTSKVGWRPRGLTSPHQRCDGKRPCTTCVNGERGTECTYKIWQRSRRAGASAFPVRREIASHPPTAHTLPSQPPATEFSFSELLTHSSLNIPLLTLSDSSESASSLLPPPPPRAPYERPLAASSHVHGEMVLGPPSDFSVARHTHDTTECLLRPTVSSFTVLPSIHFQTIPPPFPVPLSLVPPERIQISSNAGGDLDMTLYVIFGF